MKHLKTYGLALLTTFGVATTNAQDLAMNTDKPRVSEFNKSSSNDNTVKPDITIMKAAGDHSKTNNEIGVFAILGTQYDSMTDEEINERFDAMLSKTGVGIELFIQRTDKRSGSTYTSFVDGKPIGGVVGNDDLQKNIQQAINQFRRNRAVVYGNER
ncbi:MAG: hypothetical protein KDD03_11565 [Gelidibacter sp.]|nr:hypothetical protein [Gelidibacter sp.]